MPLLPLGLNPFRESVNATAERERGFCVGFQGTQERESMVKISGIGPSAGSGIAQAQRLFPIMAGFRVRSKRKQGKPEAELRQLSAPPLELNDITYVEEPTHTEHPEILSAGSGRSSSEDRAVNRGEIRDFGDIIRQRMDSRTLCNGTLHSVRPSRICQALGRCLSSLSWNTAASVIPAMSSSTSTLCSLWPFGKETCASTSPCLDVSE